MPAFAFPKGNRILGQTGCLSDVKVEGTILSHVYTFKGRHETYELIDANAVYNAGEVPTLTIYKGKSEEREYDLTPCYWLDLI